MNKKNIISGLLITILIVIIILLLILKLTIFNKKYVINMMEKNNYYKLVYKDTISTINSYIISTGLPSNIIDKTITYNDIKNNINNYIDKIYENKKYDNTLIKSKLTNNINSYLIEHNLKIDNTSELNELINEIDNLYNNETTFYKKFDNYINIFIRLKKIVELLLIILILILTIVLLMLKSIIGDILSSALMSSGLILLFIKFIIYDKIKYSSVLMITESFSNIIHQVFINISNDIVIIGILFIILSIIMMYIEIKRSKKNGRN